jgi:hypothetical protein
MLQHGGTMDFKQLKDGKSFRSPNILPVRFPSNIISMFTLKASITNPLLRNSILESLYWGFS